VNSGVEKVVSMETLRKDLRHAVRMLVKAPGFTVIAVLALGLGIGANTAIFSVFDGMLWRPLPAKNPNELVVVASKVSGIDFPINLSYRDFLDYRDLRQVFADASAMIPSPVNLGVDGRAERAWTEFVSGNMFSMLGLQPVAGRFFAPDEGSAKGKDSLMILSYKFWQSRFAGDRGVVGRIVLVQNRPFTIIGVAPKSFHGTYYFIDPDFYLPASMIPLMVSDADKFLENRDGGDFRVLARLQPGVTPQQAKVAAAPLDARLAQEFPDSHKGFELQVYPELAARPEPGLVAEFMPKLVAVFMSLVGLVLLIACANVANLILARSNGRRKEIATRTAKGASTWRITRQLLTESVVLSVVGGIVGVIIARWAALGLMSIPRPHGHSAAFVRSAHGLPYVRFLLSDGAIDWHCRGNHSGIAHCADRPCRNPEGRWAIREFRRNSQSDPQCPGCCAGGRFAAFAGRRRLFCAQL
jgi:predicted permease